MIKRIIVIIIIIVMMFIVSITIAEEPNYQLITVPEIQESDFPAELFVAHIMRIEIDEEALYNDLYLRVYLLLPYYSSQIYTVLITDGEYFVNADMDQMSGNMLRLTYKTSKLKVMGNRNWYYLVVVAIM